MSSEAWAILIVGAALFVVITWGFHLLTVILSAMDDKLEAISEALNKDADS